jgi:hypothetical protein
MAGVRETEKLGPAHCWLWGGLALVHNTYTYFPDPRNSTTSGVVRTGNEVRGGFNAGRCFIS